MCHDKLGPSLDAPYISLNFQLNVCYNVATYTTASIGLNLLSVSRPGANNFSATFLLHLAQSSSNFIGHLMVLDELWGEISIGFDNR